ncbi:MAG: hypothetical protein R2684_13190 [Pyrinomonadaceae bacterium]
MSYAIKSFLKQTGAFALVTIFFTLLTLYGLITLESLIFEDYFSVVPKAGTTQQEWLENFNFVGVVLALVAALCAVGWAITGYWFYRIKRWKSTGGRFLWLLWFFGAALFSFFTAMLSAFEVQDSGNILAMGFYLLNAIIIYWPVSILFSPASVKYAPYFARPVSV